jgi:curved DNA-binding protein CbpA
LASQHHPDKGGDTAKFQEIQAAYDTLGDSAKRQQYDNPRPQFNNFRPSQVARNLILILSLMYLAHSLDSVSNVSNQQLVVQT